jgi:site-specific recombinase XerD
MGSNGIKMGAEHPKVTHENKFKGAASMSETLIIQWLEYLSQQGKSSYTVVAYRRGVRHLTQWFERTYEEPFDATALLPRDLEHWKTYQLKTVASSPATVNQRLVAVSSFFAWCVEAEIIAKDPTRSVHAIRLEKHKPRSIAGKRLQRLLRAAHKNGNLRDIAIVEVLSETGIRVGELLALQVGDLVNLDKRSAHLIIRQGKHGSYRTVPLTKTVRDALIDYLAQHPCGGYPNAILWTGSRGSLTQSSSILRLLDKYCIQANIPKVTPHQLRHTFATRYLQNNPGDLRGLAALLGHSDLNTVMLYTEPSLDELAQRMEFPEGERE